MRARVEKVDIFGWNPSENDHGNTVYMPAFSSNKFMKMIMTGSLKPNVLLQQLQNSNIYIYIMYAVNIFGR